MNSFYSFFFQAEDGIRDLTVTGVQTCALPILNRPQRNGQEFGRCLTAFANCALVRVRSEERRVGKECRSRPLPNHENEGNMVTDAIYHVYMKHDVIDEIDHSHHVTGTIYTVED